MKTCLRGFGVSAVLNCFFFIVIVFVIVSDIGNHRMGRRFKREGKGTYFLSLLSYLSSYLSLSLSLSLFQT